MYTSGERKEKQNYQTCDIENIHLILYTSNFYFFEGKWCIYQTVLVVEINKWRGLQRPLNPLAVWGKALFSSIAELCATPAFQKKPSGYVTETNKLLYIANWSFPIMGTVGCLQYVAYCARLCTNAMERQGSIWPSTMTVSISASCCAINLALHEFILKDDM